jgi:hypothetical protein
MTVTKALVEGLKMLALFGAIALVIWSMPEPEPLHAQQGEDNESIAVAVSN